MDKSLPATPPSPPLENNNSRPCALGWKALGKRPKAKRADSAPAAGAVVVAEQRYVWKVPAGTLSGAGRLVVLRGGDGEGARREQDVRAEVTCDEEMRGVVFGDPVMREFSFLSVRRETWEGSWACSAFLLLLCEAWGRFFSLGIVLTFVVLE